MADRTERRSPALVGAVAVGAAFLAVLTGCEVDNSILRQRGIVALQQDDQSKAFDAFSRAIRQDATDWRAHYQLGKILLERDQPLDAQLAFEKARGLRSAHPETARIVDYQAEAVFRQGRHDSLRALLADAATTFGATHDFLRQGEYLTRIGEIDGARVAYIKAAQFADPDDASPYVKAAEFYEQIGDSVKAVAAWRRAYYIAPDNTAVADKLRQYGIVPGPTLTSPPRR